MKNPYDVLGLGRYATNKEIRKRYLQLCKSHHPDIVGQHKQRDFAEITGAYEQLTKHKHQVEGYRPSPFHQHTHLNTKIYTQRSLVAGLALMIGVIAYVTYEPPVDPALSYVDHIPPPSVNSPSSYRAWRKN
ncbi:uncharacterized protein BX664DRAFT_327541 [Halteromyces radiatus]|uniref:uncharacterized protein n=1 Tax=Halteromyces radiatus TaxID=101107 RepID=UPI00221FBF27|nr:uncharacterized protein BX664DRAFT_327541 [Halteromyces radiatus]KAI8092538.1 hypothetical protein BX664DRAFT_327541 [Halteromyces radiatus]